MSAWDGAYVREPRPGERCMSGQTRCRRRPEATLVVPRRMLPPWMLTLCVHHGADLMEADR